MAQIRGKALSGGDRERRTSILAWMRLARVFAKMQRVAAVQLRHWDLSVAHFDVLVQTGLAEGLTQRELAERLLITKGNLSQLLDKMERDDLLARCREGRVNCLRLTPRGRALYAEVLPARQEMVEATFAPLSAEERVTLLGLLRKLDLSLD
jgi:DNA-binding MarR family transcriptional regulator